MKPKEDREYIFKGVEARCVRCRQRWHRCYTEITKNFHVFYNDELHLYLVHSDPRMLRSWAEEIDEDAEIALKKAIVDFCWSSSAWGAPKISSNRFDHAYRDAVINIEIIPSLLDKMIGRFVNNEPKPESLIDTTNKMSISQKRDGMIAAAAVLVMKSFWLFQPAHWGWYGGTCKRANRQRLT